MASFESYLPNPTCTFVLLLLFFYVVCKFLITKLECLDYNAGGLQQELQKKSREEVRKLQNQLLQQIDSTNTEMSKNKPQLEQCEKEKTASGKYNWFRSEN